MNYINFETCPLVQYYSASLSLQLSPGHNPAVEIQFTPGRHTIVQTLKFSDFSANRECQLNQGGLLTFKSMAIPPCLKDQITLVDDKVVITSSDAFTEWSEKKSGEVITVHWTDKEPQNGFFNGIFNIEMRPYLLQKGFDEDTDTGTLQDLNHDIMDEFKQYLQKKGLTFSVSHLTDCLIDAYEVEDRGSGDLHEFISQTYPKFPITSYTIQMKKVNKTLNTLNSIIQSQLLSTPASIPEFLLKLWIPEVKTDFEGVVVLVEHGDMKKDNMGWDATGGLKLYDLDMATVQFFESWKEISVDDLRNMIRLWFDPLNLQKFVDTVASSFDCVGSITEGQKLFPLKFREGRPQFRDFDLNSFTTKPGDLDTLKRALFSVTHQVFDIIGLADFKSKLGTSADLTTSFTKRASNIKALFETLDPRFTMEQVHDNFQSTRASSPRSVQGV